MLTSLSMLHVHPKLGLRCTFKLAENKCDCSLCLIARASFAKTLKLGRAWVDVGESGNQQNEKTMLHMLLHPHAFNAQCVWPSTPMSLVCVVSHLPGTVILIAVWASGCAHTKLITSLPLTSSLMYKKTPSFSRFSVKPICVHCC